MKVHGSPSADQPPVNTLANNYSHFMRRVDVEVLAKYQLDGKIIPVSVKWDDDRTVEIDQVLDTPPAASTKVGGAKKDGALYLQPAILSRTRKSRSLSSGCQIRRW